MAQAQRSSPNEDDARAPTGRPAAAGRNRHGVFRPGGTRRRAAEARCVPVVECLRLAEEAGKPVAETGSAEEPATHQAEAWSDTDRGAGAKVRSGVDTTSQIDSSTNFMGRLQTLAIMPGEHPVDDAERRRNDLIFQNYQANRNPFIDHPEWVVLIFNSDAPVISGQPQNLSVHPGEDATFMVSAIGAEPLSYQWCFNGTNLDGAVTNFYTITNVQPSNAGSYSVLVSNTIGRVLSVSAPLSLFITTGCGIRLFSRATT